MSLRDTILATDDLPKKKIKIPEWGVDVYIATLKSVEREQWENNAKSEKEIRENLVVLVALDESGKRIFTKEDIPALKEKNSKALDRICTAAIEHNKIRKEDIDELEKN